MRWVQIHFESAGLAAILIVNIFIYNICENPRWLGNS